jgi:hypothetical protein
MPFFVVCQVLIQLTPQSRLQASILINPKNSKAIGIGTSAKGIGGDTVDGVRIWMGKLFAALKGVNPTPVIAATETQDGSQLPARIELTIEGYHAAGHNITPLAAS